MITVTIVVLVCPLWHAFYVQNIDEGFSSALSLSLARYVQPQDESDGSSRNPLGYRNRGSHCSCGHHRSRPVLECSCHYMVLYAVRMPPLHLCFCLNDVHLGVYWLENHIQTRYWLVSIRARQYSKYEELMWWLRRVRSGTPISSRPSRPTRARSTPFVSTVKDTAPLFLEQEWEMTMQPKKKKVLTMKYKSRTLTSVIMTHITYESRQCTWVIG